MSVWTRRGRRTCARNLVLVVLSFGSLLFAAWNEGYLANFSLPFELLLAGGLALSVWMAIRASTVRFFVLLLTIFFVEYVKETLGIRTGLWTYAHEQYLFGVLAWVLGGTSAFVLASGVLIPLLRKIPRELPRWLNLGLVLVLFALIVLTAEPLQPGTELIYWAFYALLLALALMGARRMPWQVLVGIVLSAWIVGNPSEYLGSVQSEFWTFKGDPKYPPFYLLAGCWPIEILVQYSLSAFLAGEPLDGGITAHPAPPSREQAQGAIRQLRIFLIGSGIVYLLVGFAFALVPDLILRGVNAVSRAVTPWLPPAGLPQERFWTALAFSMMMTIAALCFMASVNVQRNKGYVVPLLIAKAASTLSALAYFASPSHRQFAHLVIVLVDGSLFCLTLYFLVRAQQAFFLEQTGYLYDEKPQPEGSGPTTVVISHGEDKLACLDEVLEKTEFFRILHDACEASKRPPADFKIAIKPNFMFMHAKEDKSSYTDPALVEALVDRIAARGYESIFVVEARSTYGNYYDNRDVASVAKHVGYHFDRNYRIVDLTDDMIDHDYKGRLGKHFVGRTWKEADFRISFAKNKTHVFCYYTLTLKNVYGALPMQDKLLEYHTKREYDWPTIESLAPGNFPVHFGLIDAFLSADGQFGVIADPSPKATKTIIGGQNLMAVDSVGAKKMGLDPDHPLVGRYYPLAVRAFGKPDVHVIGDMSVYPGWQNVSPFFIYSLDVIEEAYHFSNWWFSVLTAMHADFPFNKQDWPTLAVRKLLAPLKRLLYPYDKL
jgi:uncharacterized protein (DUF362 family)